ncbi:MAG TPA: hypothetical protein VF137_07820 [Candidatus Dormibacteraeota bacterium]
MRLKFLLIAAVIFTAACGSAASNGGSASMHETSSPGAMMHETPSPGAMMHETPTP